MFHVFNFLLDAAGKEILQKIKKKFKTSVWQIKYQKYKINLHLYKHPKF